MSDLVERIAEAMKAKRAEMINQPLAAIWPQLAAAAIEATGVSEYNLEGLSSGWLSTCDGYCHEQCGLSE